MSEFKGTKGKWEVNDSPYVDEEGKYAYHGQFDITSGETTAARVYAYNFFNIQFEEAKANAQLISKAPEMLDLLINFVRADPSDGTWNYQACMDKARQLIKEATTI